MNYLVAKKKLIDERRNRINVLSPKVAELVSVQYNLADNQYQQNSGLIYTFTPNIFYTYLLNVPSILVFLKTYNTEFDKIIIKFTDQNVIRNRR